MTGRFTPSTPRTSAPPQTGCRKDLVAHATDGRNGAAGAAPHSPPTMRLSSATSFLLWRGIGMLDGRGGGSKSKLRGGIPYERPMHRGRSISEPPDCQWPLPSRAIIWPSQAYSDFRKNTTRWASANPRAAWSAWLAALSSAASEPNSVHPSDFPQSATASQSNRAIPFRLSAGRT